MGEVVDVVEGRLNEGVKVEFEQWRVTRRGDEETAAVLNRLGRRTGTGKRWNGSRVKSARHRQSIPGRRRALNDPDILSLGGAARHCGVSDTTIKRLVDNGLLPRKQIVPFAPWEIRRADLESQPVRSIIEQLRQTGKLVMPGDASQNQLDFSL